MMMVYVDDLMCVGEEGNLKRLERALGAKYEMICKTIWPEPHQEHSAEHLGRLITFEEGGSITSDPKHVELLLKESGMTECKEGGTSYVTERTILEELGKTASSWKGGTLSGTAVTWPGSCT